MAEMDGPRRAVHGGGFFADLGEDFSGLDDRDRVVNADVLDAWYDPSPRVVEAIQKHLPWLIKTSPPVHAEGLLACISAARGIPESCLAVGAGSSPLIFSGLPMLAAKGDPVLVLDPTYGEYPHVLETLIGAEVRRLPLEADAAWMPDPLALAEAAQGCRLICLVNPNSPTGAAVDRGWLESLLRALPVDVMVWVDETYIDFCPPGWSAEPLVASTGRVVVLKSLSKFYALSGIRAGYLAGPPWLVQRIQEQSPPWALGLIAQFAAVEALGDPDYYAARAAETADLRDALAVQLKAIPGVKRIFPSRANYLMFELHEPRAEEVCAACAAEGVHLRDCSSLSPRFDGRFLRTAVKAAPESARIAAALQRALAP
jgi:histidinol-phosphate/aromatic aminotransferase/cobyric acid decarboxylase-like protein